MTLSFAFIRKISLLLTFLLLFEAVQAQTASFDVISYDSQIEPDISSKTIRGKVALRFNSLANNLVQIQLNSGNLEIDAVREDKTALKFEKKDNLLIIALSRPAKLNEKREIEIEYHGAPHFGIRFFPELKQVYTVFSTSQWMPVVDAPDDRTTFRLNLILPKDLKAVGNGKLVKQTILQNGKNAYYWEQKTPIPTYIFGFAAGDFREVVQSHKGVKFRYLASPQFSEAEIKQIFRDTLNMFDFFTGKAGVKYPDQTYTQVLATGGVQQEMSSFAAMNTEYGKGVFWKTSARTGSPLMKWLTSGGETWLRTSTGIISGLTKGWRLLWLPLTRSTALVAKNISRKSVNYAPVTKEFARQAKTNRSFFRIGTSLLRKTARLFTIKAVT